MEQNTGLGKRNSEVEARSAMLEDRGAEAEARS